MNDPRYWEYVKIVKDAVGLQVIVLPMHEQDELQPYTIVSDGTTYEFLWLIKNASLICTDSFHACVVSLIYHKEFYLLRRSRKAENAKYDDLLRQYRLEDRLVNDEHSFIRKSKIDYSYVDEQLEKDRESANGYLKQTLCKCL